MKQQRNSTHYYVCEILLQTRYHGISSAIDTHPVRCKVNVVYVAGQYDNSTAIET